MSKRDLFVIIYCCLFGAIGVIGATFSKDRDLFVILFNVVFLGFSALMVVCRPVKKMVDKLIEKLP